MSSVDDRIVNMQFNNKQFESGVSTSMKSLDGLEKTLANSAKSKGLEGMAASVDKVSGRFSAMQVAGVTAVATIANKAVNAGINLVKSLTIDPILDGFREYQTGLDSIQTIMANTGKSVKVVNAGLDKLNAFADQTIYNFGQMAKNVGTFTAAGVDLDTSIQSIKGIANLAALSGSSAEQASGAMYQLSQAIAAGKVGLQDWNSVVNAGMGGKTFQQALARTAETMGTLQKGSVALVGPMQQLKISGASFRESISAGSNTPPWLTSDVLVETLKQVAGGYTLAELKAKGFSEANAKAIIKMQKAAFNAATQIKTLPQLFGVIKESIGSTFSGIFRTVLGDFSQSKKLWTDVGNAIIGPQGFLTKAQNRLERFFQIWADFGGRTIAVDAFKRVFSSLGAIFEQVGKAFHDVFPKADHNSLLRLTKIFHSLAVALTPSEGALKSLRSIFGGLFAVLHIGLTVLSAVRGLFSSFFVEVFKGSSKSTGGLLSFLGTIGDLLVKLDKFVTQGGATVTLFKNLGKAAGKMVGGSLSMASDLIAGLVDGLTGAGLSELKQAIEGLGTQMIGWIKDVLGIHSPATEMIPVGLHTVQGIVEGILSGIKYVFSAMGEVVGAIISGIGHFFTSVDPLEMASFMNALFTGALILSIKKLSDGFGTFAKLGDTIAGTFGQLTDTLKTMQQAVKAKIIMMIAIAVGVLTAAVLVLAFIPMEKLAQGLGAIAIMVGLLVGSMKALSKVDAKTKLAVISTTFVTMATSILILAAALKVMSTIPIADLAKGVGAIGALLAIMMGVMVGLSKFTRTAPIAAGAMISMATAIGLLTASLAILALIPVKNLAKGIGAIAVLMGLMMGVMIGISSFTRTAPVAAGAMIAMAVAIGLLVASVTALGLLPIKVLVKGIAAIAAMLVLLTAAMVAMSLAGPASAIAAAGMVLIATAIGMLVPLLIILGNMDWGTIVKGLVALSAIIVVLAAGVLLIGGAATIVAPGLLALGTALALVGLGMLAFGTGFALLAAAGTAGVAVLMAGFTAFMALLPSFAIQVAAAVVTFIETIAAAAPKLRAAFSKIFSEIIGVVRDAIPELGALLQDLITTGIGILRESIPQWIEMGFTIIDEFLKSAADHVPDIVDSVGDLIENFIRELDNNLQDIIDAGTDLIIHFIQGLGEASVEIADATGQAILDVLNGLDAAIVKYSSDIRDAGLRIAGHLLDGMTGGLAGKAGDAIGGALGTAGDVIGALNPLGRSLAVSAKALTPAQAVAAATKMANAIIAGGDKAVAKAQAVASAKQIAADVAQAKVIATRMAAQKLRKTDPKEAKKLLAMAEKQQKAADAAQVTADRAAQNVSNVREFQEADLHGKGDIKSAQAQALADRANEMLAKANAEAARAHELMKTNKKAGQAMLVQAKKDAQEAKALAAQAQASNQSAVKFYAQEVTERIKQLEADRKADEQARKDQEEYDNADTLGKAEIMRKRAEEDQKRADAANAAATKYIAQAKKLAATDAEKAMHLLDLAAEQAQIAEDAANQAKQEKDQSAQLLEQASQPGASGAGGTSGAIQPSRSVLEDAASAVDRYTQSLQQASELAAATQPVVQFVQNNTSPVALSTPEIYRQSKNLLSAAEVKMGAP